MESLTQIEKELMTQNIKPIYKKRDDRGFKIDYVLSKSLSNTLNKIKGRIYQQIGETGDLDIEEFIDFKINQKSGIINNFDIFEDTIEKNGLDVVLLIDCSGSMRRLRQKLADITATILHSMSKCEFINFKTIAYSASGHKYQSYLDEIKNYNESGRVHADENNYHDIHNLAMNEAVKILEKSEDKKLIIMITDGYPEAVYKGRTMDTKPLQSLMERSIIEANNKDIEVFCLYYCHIPSTIPQMNKIFKGKMFSTENFNDIQKKLSNTLIKTVERMNESGI